MKVRTCMRAKFEFYKSSLFVRKGFEFRKINIIFGLRASNRVRRRSFYRIPRRTPAKLAGEDGGVRRPVRRWSERRAGLASFPPHEHSGGDLVKWVSKSREREAVAGLRSLRDERKRVCERERGTD